MLRRKLEPLACWPAQYAKLPRRAWDDPRLHQGAKLTLAVILCAARGRRQFTTYKRSLAADARVCERTMYEHLKLLEATGYIITWRASRRSPLLVRVADPALVRPPAAAGLGRGGLGAAPQPAPQGRRRAGRGRPAAAPDPPGARAGASRNRDSDSDDPDGFRTTKRRRLPPEFGFQEGHDRDLRLPPGLTREAPDPRTGSWPTVPSASPRNAPVVQQVEEPSGL